MLLHPLLVLAAPVLGAGAPSLSYSGAELGSTLELDLAGAPASAPVGLLYSPAAGEVVLTQGILGLDPFGLQLIGGGTADPAGELGFSFPVAMNANLAEAELHLQAFALDPAAPGGAVLSDAVHTRVRGSRVYAYDDTTTELVVFSAVRDELVFRSSFGPGDGPMTAPVFDANHAQGAFVYGDDELYVFDNHFGTVVQSASNVVPHLVPAADGASFWGLSDDDRFLRISFATGEVLETHDLSAASGSLETRWAANSDATIAYAEHSDGSNRVQLRGVDLVTGADLGILQLAPTTDTELLQLEAAGPWVIAVSGSEGTAQDTLTQIDTSTQPATLLTREIRVNETDGVAILLDRGEILAWHSEFQGFVEFEPFEMNVVPLGTLGPLELVGAPAPAFGSGESSIDWADFAYDDEGWFVRRCCKEPPSGDESGSIWSFDVATRTWGTTPNGTHDGPYGAGAIDDAFGNRVFVGRNATPNPDTVRRLTAFDAVTMEDEDFPIESEDTSFATLIVLSGEIVD